MSMLSHLDLLEYAIFFYIHYIAYDKCLPQIARKAFLKHALAITKKLWYYR